MTDEQKQKQSDEWDIIRGFEHTCKECGCVLRTQKERDWGICFDCAGPLEKDEEL